MTMSRTIVGLTLALAVGSASADERFDHEGAVGLLVAGGAEYGDYVARNAGRRGSFFDTDLGATWAIGSDGNELTLMLRAAWAGAGRPGLTGTVGYRGYFGRERVKTFLDAGLSVRAMPELTVGPRLGCGVQFELSPVVGLFVGPALQVGYGGGIRFSGELIGGLQLRSYLLE